MFMRQFKTATIAAAFLLLTGCGPAKLNETRNYEMEPGNPKGFVLSKQSKPQTVTIEFKSSDADVTVLLFNSEDVTDNNADDVDSAKALGFKTGKAETFTVNVPENTEARLVVRGNKRSTKVDLKVTN